MDESRGAIVAIDPFEPTKRWMALASPADNATTNHPWAIGCLDTSMLVVLAQTGENWSLATHRLQPGTAADPGQPTQTLSIGKAPVKTASPAAHAGTNNPSIDGRPCLAVSPSRDWLGVCGLPAPLPPVLRAPIAGARIGTVSARGCPLLGAAVRPATATISPGEEFILFTSELGREVAADRPERSAAALFVSFSIPPDPRQLLHLDTSLSMIRDAAFCRADGTLWVVGGGAAGTGEGDGPREAAGGNSVPATLPEGLWRIDAVLRNGRQAAKAVCVARLDGARSVICLSERAIIVTHGRGQRTVSRIDPTQPASQP